MNKNKLEQSSITKLRDCIDRCSHLTHELKENDKSPSWDGEITAYKSENFKVSKMIGTARIQVKAHGINDVSELSKSNISYPVRVDDLRNYLNDGGTIYFVIHIYSFDSYKIYYNALLPLDISNWLKIACNQQTISIPFSELTPSNHADVEKIVLNFLNDRKKQFSIVTVLPEDDKGKAVMLSRFNQFSFGVVGTSDPFGYMLKHPIYIYGDMEYTKIPLHRINAEEISTTIPMEVSVNGALHYSEVTIKKTVNDEKLCFGECFQISMTENNISYVEKGDFDCRLKALNFIKDLREFKRLDMDKSRFSFDSLEFGDETEFNSHFAKLKNLYQALKYFGVTKSLAYDVIDEESDKNLRIIVAAYMNSGIVTFDEPVDMTVSCMEINNLRILISIAHINGLTYKLQNLFTATPKNCELRFDDQVVPCSIFCILKQHDFETISNMNYELLLQDLKAYPFQSIYTDKLVALLLDMLRAYDVTKSRELLDACENLAGHIKDSDETVCIHKLNYLQCVRRSRNYTESEKQLLYAVRNTEADFVIQLGIAILLENQNDINYYYSKLSEDAKREFLSFPIVALAEQLFQLREGEFKSSP